MLEQGNTEQTKEHCFNVILDKICLDGDSLEIEKMKNIYNCKFDTNFEFDNLRYDYAFLKGVTMYQAVKLYDNLKDEMRNDFISVIEHDHHHLKDLVHIHKTVTTMNVQVQTCLAS